jgi:hypothetical protein
LTYVLTINVVFLRHKINSLIQIQIHIYIIYICIYIYIYIYINIFSYVYYIIDLTAIVDVLRQNNENNYSKVAPILQKELAKGNGKKGFGAN